MTVGGTELVSELSDDSRRARAVEAALAAGRRRRPRPTPRARAAARCGSTAARSRASPRRPRAGSASAPGSAAGSATPTAPTSPRPGSRRSPPAPPRRPRVADEDEFAAPPRAGRGRGAGRASTTPRSPPGRPPQVAELALAVERDGARRRPARRRRRAGRLRRLRRAGRDRLLDRPRRRVRGSSCFAYLQALAEGDGGRETGLGFGLARGPEALDPEAIGAEGAERAAGDDRRRQARLALLPGRPRPDRRRQLRRPDRRRPRRRRRAARALAVRRPPRRGARRRRPSPSHDDGRDPAGPASAPVRRRGGAAPPHRADRGRPPARLPLRHLHRQPRGRRARPATRAARRLPLAALGLDLEPGRRARRARASTELLAEAGEGVFVTDVAGLHSGVNPVTGVFSVGASGRAIRGGELAEPLREFTIAGDLVAMLGAVRGRRRGGSLGPVRRLGQHPAAADRRDGDQRFLTFGSGAVHAVAAVRLRRSSTPEEESRRDQG